ncbi:hypothetical protein BGW39_004060 [Mortierella sp. 14UC]|nr:hypothetical protein BGW39_004060 [Mortierella sp. 14UC]
MTDRVRIRDRDPESEPETEQLVVGQDARNRRLRLKRWAGFGCALLFIAIALSAAFWLPFFFNDRDSRLNIPSKIVVPDQRIFLSLGHPAGGLAAAAGGGRGGGEELVSFVQLESEASVKDVTIHVVEVDFTKRMFMNNDDEIFVSRDDGANKKNSKDPNLRNPTEGDEGDGKDDLEEPALVYGTTKTDTGTHVQFRVGRSKRNPIEQAQLRLKVTVPLGFTGELTIDGTQLHIESGSSLAKARFNLLHLTAHTGDFVLDGSSNNGDDDDNGGDGGNGRGGRRKRRDDDVPVLRVSTLNAQITHSGSITVGPIKSATRGRSFRTRLETQMGDVSLVPIVTMITPNKDRPWEYPDEEDLVYSFNPVSHSHGSVHLDIRQGEADEEEGGGDGEDEGYWVGTVLVTAQAKEGSVTGRVDLNDLQLVTVNANSYADTILEVSDLFVGDVAVTSSHLRKATIVQVDDSETVIQYSHSEPSKKLGVKVFPNPNENFSLGIVGVHSTHGSATLIFS